MSTILNVFVMNNQTSLFFVALIQVLKKGKTGIIATKRRCLVVWSILEWGKPRLIAEENEEVRNH